MRNPDYAKSPEMSPAAQTLKTEYGAVLPGALVSDGPERWTAARAELDLAREAFQRDEFAQAEALAATIMRATAAPSRSTGVASDCLDLRASAASLLAQSLAIRGETGEARTRAEESIALFQQWFATATAFNALHHLDYGAALLLAERYADAIGHLRTALSVSGMFSHVVQNYLGIALQGAGRPAEAADAFLESAVALRNRNDLPRALDVTNYALSLMPGAQPILRLQGILLQQLNRYDEAITALEQLGPEAADTQALMALGVAARQTARFDKAAAAVLQAIELDPQYVLAYAELGEIRRLEGQYDEAIAALDKAIAMSPDFPWALATKGQVLGMLARYDEAAPAFARALELDATLLWAYPDYAIALHTLGDNEKALQIIDVVLATIPDYVQALTVKGRVLNALRRPVDALAVFEHALTLDPGQQFALAFQAQSYSQLGRYDDAERSLRRALEFNQSPWLYAELVEVLRLQGRFEEAVAVLDDSSVMGADSAWTLGTRSQCLRALGQYEEALVFLRRAQELSPTSAWLYAEEAENLKSQGRFEEALEPLDRAIALLPDYGNALATKGVVLRALHRVEDSIPPLLKAVATNPGSPWYQAELGESFRLLGHYELALQALDRALAEQPDYAAGRATRGQVLRAQGRLEDAANDLKVAVVADPNILWAYDDLFDVMQMLRRQEEMIPVLEAAASLHPDIGFLHARLGEMLRQSKRYEESLVHLDRALELQPDGWTLATRGQVLRALDRSDEALEAVQRAVEVQPRLAWAWAELGSLLHARAQYDDAIDAFKAALALAPDNPEWLAQLGETLRVRLRYDEALDALNAAVAKRPDYAWALATRGQILRAQGRYADAIASLTRGLELDNAMGWAHADLGEAYRATGGFVEALEALDRAIALGHATPWTVGTRGQVLRALGRNEEALEALQQARNDSDPGRVWVTIEIGDLLRTVARYEEAIEVLDIVLDVAPDSYVALASKADALRTLDRTEQAIPVIDRAIAVDPTYAFAWGVKGLILIDIGEFADAVAAFERSTQLDDSSGWVWGSRGFAAFRADRSRVAEARDAYQKAIDLDDDDLHWNIGLADALVASGEVSQGRALFQSVVADIHDRSAQTTDAADDTLMGALGWCRQRLGEYDEAARVFHDILLNSPDRVGDRFNLALALMCASRFSISLTEFATGVSTIASLGLDASRRRGLCLIALFDVEQAIDENPLLADSVEVRQIVELLTATAEGREVVVPRPALTGAVAAPSA